MKLLYQLNKFLNLFLSFFLFSLLGWIYETLLFYVLYGNYYDRGYLNLPICPIYGTTITIMFIILGTIEEPSVFIKFITNIKIRKTVYLSVAFFLPTLVEYIVGYYFDHYKNIRLWDYSYMPFNINGYVCLYYSLFWAVGIYLITNKIFPKVIIFIDKYPILFKLFLFLFLSSFIVVDLLKKSAIL